MSGALPQAGLRLGGEDGAVRFGSGRGCLRCTVEQAEGLDPSRRELLVQQGARLRSAWIDAATGRVAAAPVVLRHDPLADLGVLLDRTRLGGRSAPERTSVGGWIGWISYELGRWLEPRAQSERRLMRESVGGEGQTRWPLMEVMRIDRLGAGPLERAGLVDGLGGTPAPKAGLARPGGLYSAMGREGYERAVRRAIEYIHAGDVYQVNLAHELTGEWNGTPRQLLRRLWTSADPRFGGWFVPPPDEDGTRRAVVSASPELFLEYEAATRRIVTRPMKGTRAVGNVGEGRGDGRAGAISQGSLAESAKDRAELAMIVDLMRNDLGRVAAIGSVRVSDPRRIEAHGTGGATLLQATGEVTAMLREGRDIVDLLRATFPPGSVTGAPKVRAMQIIGELELGPRGPYCGTLFLIDDLGNAWFNVMIRTALLEMPPGGPGRLRYSVGAGIVADSDAAAEWNETLDKARVLNEALR